MDTAGKLTGVLVFVIGIVLLGVVFKYTLDTVASAESAVRNGDLVLRPLWGGPDAPAAYPPDVRGEPRRSVPAEAPPSARPGAGEVSAESGAAEAKPMSPMARFGIALGARMVGLCALGFLAGLIATQGAQMAGAFRTTARRESLP